jgi:hypothetical protein
VSEAIVRWISIHEAKQVGRLYGVPAAGRGTILKAGRMGCFGFSISGSRYVINDADFRAWCAAGAPTVKPVAGKPVRKRGSRVRLPSVSFLK